MVKKTKVDRIRNKLKSYLKEIPDMLRDEYWQDDD